MTGTMRHSRSPARSMGGCAGTVSVNKVWRWLRDQIRVWYGRGIGWAGGPTLFVTVAGGVVAVLLPRLIPNAPVTGYVNWFLGAVTNYQHHRSTKEDPIVRRSELNEYAVELESLKTRQARLEGSNEALAQIVRNLYSGRPLGAPGAPPAVPGQQDH